MNALEYRSLYQSTMDRLLFFPNDDLPERKKICEDLFLEAWGRIPQIDREKILENLEFILCKNIIDFWQRNTPACALLNKLSLRCFVIFDPFSDTLEHETRVHILAHEFAHVFYNHPGIGSEKRDEFGSKGEKEYRDKVAEPQAYALTEEWKIIPHHEDIRKLSDYRKFVLKEI